MIKMDQLSQTNRSIRELQHMLNHISRHHDGFPRLTEDGDFNEQTLEAVMVFQRDFFPPVTGVVNHDTWYAIVDEYQKSLLPSSLRVLPSGNYSAGPGQQDDQLLLAQALFASLARMATNFERTALDGVNSGATLNNIRQVQQLAGLTQDGIFNLVTWEFLSRLYHAYVTRSAHQRLP